MQFPLADPLPEALIRRVITQRVKTVAYGLPKIGTPATAALKTAGVTRRSQLGNYTEQDLLALHGFGPKALRILREAGVHLEP
ncbi:hypothetical protein [Actinomyces minihominis]|uniref:hypothetical protein n=1 Tax=Actinomyces minihominis TaxID=2002838 RepID=UPI001A92B09D|nr:hypothetical protein [Actinomyces minihominis]